MGIEPLYINLYLHLKYSGIGLYTGSEDQCSRRGHIYRMHGVKMQ
jgi:hypothetical protein